MTWDIGDYRIMNVQPLGKAINRAFLDEVSLGLPLI